MDQSHFIHSKFLTEEKWKNIIGRAGILCGRKVRCSASISRASGIATTPLISNVDGTVDCFYSAHTSTHVEKVTSESRTSDSEDIWLEQNVDIRLPEISTGAGVGFGQSRLSRQSQRTRLFIARQRFERARLKINISRARNALREDFRVEIDSALSIGGDRKKSLNALFEKWGHEVAAEAVLGAERQVFVQASNVLEISDEDIQTWLHAKLTLSEPASMDVFRSSAGQSMTQTHAVQRGIERIWSHFIGGNSEYHGEETLGPWRKTIELPENWQIIERMDFIPITELLPPEISQEIASLLFRPLIGKWIQSEHIEPIKCTHHQVYQARISENDSKEGWHTLGQSIDGSKILVVKESYWGRGALLSMEAAAVKGISQTQHLTHNDAFYDLRAPSVEYASLGSFFSILPRGSKEVVQGPKEHNRFCFVQRKLLSQAKYSDTPVWEEKSLVKQMKRKVSAWKINPLVVKGVPTTFNLNMCRMALGSNKPNDSAWGLKVDCVDIVDE